MGCNIVFTLPHFIYSMHYLFSLYVSLHPKVIQWCCLEFRFLYLYLYLCLCFVSSGLTPLCLLLLTLFTDLFLFMIQLRLLCDMYPSLLLVPYALSATLCSFILFFDSRYSLFSPAWILCWDTVFVPTVLLVQSIYTTYHYNNNYL